MKRYIAPVAALFVIAGLAIAGEVKSGLDLGETTTPFNVKDITGPNKGKSLCYRRQYGAKPVTCIFTREINDSVASLIQQIDTTVGANKDKNMKAFVVLLTNDADAGAKQLASLADTKGIKNTPLTVYDGSAGPEKYKIAKDAAITVLMWNKGHVAVNNAFTSAKLSDDEVKKVAGETSKILN
jgi:hypothetical protein